MSGLTLQRAARLQLRWDGLSNLRAEYFLERSALDSTPEYLSNPAQNGEDLYGGFTYYADPSGPMHTTYRPIDLPLSTSNHTAQGLTLSWHAWPALVVESRTGYRTMNANEQQDYAETHGLELWAYTPLLGGAYDNPAKEIPEVYEHPGTRRGLAELGASCLVGRRDDRAGLDVLGDRDGDVLPVRGVRDDVLVEDPLRQP